MTLHVRYTFWYISFPSSAKQQREMTSFKFFLENGNTRGWIFLLLLDLSAIPANSVPGQFESTPNENEQHKLETGNGRSERMRRRFAAVSERVVSSESYNLIGSGSGQNFPISDHGHGNRAKTIEWKLKNNIPRLNSGIFFIYGLKMRIFCQLTVLRKSNKEGN